MLAAIMVRAELKRLHSPDAYDLRAFIPLRPDHFGLFVQAMVGPTGDDSEESFDFMVCTPAWLAGQVQIEGPLLVRHHVVVAAYDFNALERFVRSFCEECTGATWREAGAKVGRLGRWEFEDYRASTNSQTDVFLPSPSGSRSPSTDRAPSRGRR
jgi:hypothetical protein